MVFLASLARMGENRAIRRWRRQLEDWAIPEHILSSAPASPWVLPPECFTARTNPPNQPTTKRSLDLLRNAGSAPTILDVGCGAGRASLHLVPPAVSVTGVDQREELLTRFRAEAAELQVPVTTSLGKWPVVAAQVPSADLVICAQVLYNVADIEPFLGALDDHARAGVVLEIDTTHPLTKLTNAWKHFWDLDRPDGPSAADILDVLEEMGIRAQANVTDLPDHKERIEPADVKRTRMRLCLTADRDEEIRQFLESEERPGRQLATIWWER